MNVNNLLSKLKDRGVIKGYTLIGAFAVSVRARPRATKDIDFLVLADDPNYFYNEINSLIGFMDYQAEFIKGELNDPIRFLIRIYDKEKNPIADFIGSYRDWEKEIINSSDLIHFPMQEADKTTIDIPVPLEEDLVILKVVSGNAQDIIDAEEILKVASTTQKGINFNRLFTMAKKAKVLKKLKQILDITGLMPSELPPY